MKIKPYLLASALCVLPFAASAADLPVKAPYRAVAPVPFSWTGFYVGGSVGIIGQNATSSDTFGYWNGNPGEQYGMPAIGGLFGINVGYNYQMGNWVLGVEADIAAATPSYSQPMNGLLYESKLTSLGTVRGRIGYAFDRALFYGTGGFAYGQVKNSITVQDSTSNVWSTSSTRTGWTAGGGVEYAVTNNWTVRAEALYVDLGSTSANNTGNSGCNFGFKNKYTVGRLGFNYKF